VVVRESEKVDEVVRESEKVGNRWFRKIALVTSEAIYLLLIASSIVLETSILWLLWVL